MRVKGENPTLSLLQAPRCSANLSIDCVMPHVKSPISYRIFRALILSPLTLSFQPGVLLKQQTRVVIIDETTVRNQ
jgi:hypothetical protein